MFVRSSKFRHVFGSPARKEQCYEGIRVTKSAHDSNFCAVNPSFLAVVVESAGGGAFLVIPLEKTGRIEVNTPKVCGHRGPVTDIKWNPFNDYVIASASDDTTIKLWEIPECGLTENLSSWTVDLQGHSKRINYIEWHPTAADVLLSAGADFQCILWNTRLGSGLQVISVHPDVIFSISWNRDGSLFATTCKDKLIRVIDPRSGEIVAQAEGHHGSKASKVVFLGTKNLLFTTGFSRTSERQYALWDTNNFSKPLKMEDIDASSGLMVPFYDHDTNMVYLAGKGDGNIRYVEIVDCPPYAHYLSQYQSSAPQRGFGVMPKRGVDTSRCEVFRFYKLHTLKDLCEPISMIVPRKSEVFQADIYPPTASGQASLTVDEWLNGLNREPVLVSLKDGTVQQAVPSRDSSQCVSENRSAFTATSSFREKQMSSSANRTTGFQAIREPAFNRESAFHRVPAVNRDPLPANGHMIEQMAYGKPSNTDELNFTNNNYKSYDYTSTTSVFDVDSVGGLSRSSSKTSESPFSPPLRANVQRAATFHGSGSCGPTRYDDRSGLSQCSTALSTNRLHVVRNTSLLSDAADVSDIPVTPVAASALKTVRKHRRRRRNDDSSSCSSMEDLDTQVSAWTENPLYSQNKSPPGRRKNGRMPHRRAPPPAQSTVDLAPLNEVLNSAEFRSPNRPLSKSSGDLVSKLGGDAVLSKMDFDLTSKSSGDLMSKVGGNIASKSSKNLTSSKSAGDYISKSGNDLMTFPRKDSSRDNEIRRLPDNQVVPANATNAGGIMPKSQFRSEPDIAAHHWGRLENSLAVGHRYKASEPDVRKAPLARAEDDTIFEDDLSPEASRAMIDCISMEAPDDTVIKPSRLRASMNSRQRRGTPSSETSSTASSITTGVPLRRTGSLRESKSSFMGNSDIGSPFPEATPPTLSPPAPQPSAFHLPNSAPAPQFSAFHPPNVEKQAKNAPAPQPSAFHLPNSAPAPQFSAFHPPNVEKQAKNAPAPQPSAFHLPNSAPAPQFSAFHPPNVEKQAKNAEVVISARKVIPPSSVPPPARFVLPGTSKGPVLPNPFVFTVPAENPKKASAAVKLNVETGGQVNGIPKDSTDFEQQRLQDLCKRQADEIIRLRQQLTERDAKIQLLESRLRNPVGTDARHLGLTVTKSSV